MEALVFPLLFLLMAPFAYIVQHPVVSLVALVLAIGLIALLRWARRRPKRVVVTTLEKCPSCGDPQIRRERRGAGWQIWCGECRRLHTAVLMTDPRKAGSQPRE